MNQTTGDKNTANPIILLGRREKRWHNLIKWCQTRFSFGFVVQNKIELVRCTQTTLIQKKLARLLFDVTLLRGGYVTLFYSTISCWRGGILTRIFILLVTVKEFADRGHPVAPTHSQGVDDVWTNQNVVGNIMLENISSQWCARFSNGEITLIKLTDWSDHPSVLFITQYHFYKTQKTAS